MDCSLADSSVHGIFQARVLEWVAISFFRGSSRPRDRTQVSSIADRRFTVWATREAPRSQLFILAQLCHYYSLNSIQGKALSQWSPNLFGTRDHFMENNFSTDQRWRWDGITDSMDVIMIKLREIVKARKAWHAAIYGVAKSWTWPRDWTTMRGWVGCGGRGMVSGWFSLGMSNLEPSRV